MVDKAPLASEFHWSHSLAKIVGLLKLGRDHELTLLVDESNLATQSNVGNSFGKTAGEVLEPGRYNKAAIPADVPPTAFAVPVWLDGGKSTGKTVREGERAAVQPSSPIHEALLAKRPEADHGKTFLEIAEHVAVLIRG